MYQTVHVSHLTSFHSSNQHGCRMFYTNQCHPKTYNVYLICSLLLCIWNELLQNCNFRIFPMYNMVLRYINTGTKYHILYSLVMLCMYVRISTLLLVLVLIFRTPHIEALSLHFRINCFGYNTIIIRSRSYNTKYSNAAKVYNMGSRGKS